MIIKTVSQPLLKEEIILSLAKATVPHIAGALDPEAIFRTDSEGTPSIAAQIILAHVVEQKPKAKGVSDELIQQFKRDLYSKDYTYFAPLFGLAPIATAMLFTLMNDRHAFTAANIQSLFSQIQSLTSLVAELREELETLKQNSPNN